MAAADSNSYDRLFKRKRNIRNHVEIDKVVGLFEELSDSVTEAEFCTVDAIFHP